MLNFNTDTYTGTSVTNIQWCLVVVKFGPCAIKIIWYFCFFPFFSFLELEKNEKKEKNEKSGPHLQGLEPEESGYSLLVQQEVNTSI